MNDEQRLGTAIRRILRDGSSKSLPSFAIDTLRKRNAIFQDILEKGLPDEGLDDMTIEDILMQLAAMDANNNQDGCGVGEREGRIYSNLVRRRHWGLSHGIGRSGNITEIQPKAAGSTIIQKLTTRMAEQMIKIAGLGLNSGWRTVVLPMATGMALSFALRAIGTTRPDAKYVLMPRIDQKSCIKCVSMAGYELLIIPNCIEGDSIVTDLVALRDHIQFHGADKIAAVVSTTSCFAPRVGDKLVEIGMLVEAYGIPQIVNNAYGLQSTKAMNLIREAMNRNYVAAIVQSTDKNFMVPVGGSIIIAKGIITNTLEQMYPGRASIAPLVDLFITFLSMGRKGYKTLLDSRRENYRYFVEHLRSLEASLPLRVLDTPKNDISIAIAIQNIALDQKVPIGSYLFVRGVSGARILSPSAPRSIEGIDLANFGMHHAAYPHCYLTVASAIGQTRQEIELFVDRFKKYFAHDK